MEDPEVQGRLALCVDELNIWERVDAAADKLAPLSAPEREFLRRWLPRGRDLRHRIYYRLTPEGMAAEVPMVFDPIMLLYPHYTREKRSSHRRRYFRRRR